MKSITVHQHRLWLTWALAIAFWGSCFGTLSPAAVKKASPTAARPTATSSLAPAINSDTISRAELRRHVTRLASDEFKGRNPAGEGGILAARYVAEEFKKIGLQPAGDDGAYFQPFTLSLPRYLSHSSGRKIPKLHMVSTSSPQTSTKNTGSYSPMSEEEIQAAARKLNCWLENRVREFFFECKTYECRNVLGLLPGSDPELKKEVIIVSAHYDHLGIRDGKVYNGADDNASGTAAMLEIARVLKQRHDNGKGPARSILFAAWDAEEKGLCGSWNWAAEPTLPWKQVVTVINLDMIGRMRNRRLIMLGSASSSELDRLVATRAKQANFRLRRWKKSSLSDHWPFFVSGIPCLTFSTGTHQDYHSPRDDVEWIHFTNLSRIARMSLDLVSELADREKPVPFTGGGAE